ncbi:MAG: acyltransferase family protein [Paludibacteraceae bacterium]|nr:acyltransferase family protein [Paludibacteraceae bacterium]
MTKNESNGNLRVTSIDVVAGIMIIDMISYHCYGLPFQIFLSFFMPWFFFKSGMFYRRQSVKECIRKSAKKLLYPFLTFTIVGCLVYFLIFLQEGNHDWSDYFIIPLKELLLDGSVYGDKPLWFLFSFFVVKVLFSLIESNTKYYVVFIIPAIIVVYVLYLYGNPLPRYFGNVCSGFVFYTLGYILREIQYNKYVSVTAIGVYLLFVVLGIPFVDMFPNELKQGVYLLWFVFSIAGCITFNSVFEKIPYKFKIFSWAGKHAMTLYITHYIVIRLYYVAVEPFEMNGKVVVLGLFATLAIVEYLLVQLFKNPKMQFMFKPISATTK